MNPNLESFDAVYYAQQVGDIATKRSAPHPSLLRYVEEVK